MRAVRISMAGVFAVALAAIALLPAVTEAQQSVTIALAAQNNSGQSGTAVLTADGQTTKVVIILSNAPGPHPAHIHSGSCPTPGAVVFPLMSVVNGRSETTVAAPLSAILAAAHAINVHKSPTEIQAYTACGDISLPGGPVPPVAPAAQASPAAKPAAQAPAPAPAQAPRPMASPSALPRTGEADPTAGLWEVVAGGVALVVVGAALLAWRRRSSS